MPVFRIDSSVFEIFPDARFSAVIVHGVNNRVQDPRIDQLLTIAVEKVR